MRLIQYLNEKEITIEMPVDDQINLIKKDCKKYIKLTKSTGPFRRYTYIGYKLFTSDEKIIIKKDVRPDRKPSGTNKKAFEIFNDWLEKHGHNKRDNSICACGTNTIFGKGFYFFPIGNVSYTWIKAKDVNVSDDKTGWSNYDIENFFNIDVYIPADRRETKTEKEFSSYFTTDKGIEIAYKNNYETWFKCKQYYIVNSNVDVKDIYK